MYFGLPPTLAVSDFEFRISNFRRQAFTLIELLVVMAIIIVLAGLVLATSGYVQEKSKRSRAEAEIAAISAALENYKADNGVYPSNPATDDADPNAEVQPEPSRFLYRSLSGDTDFDGAPEEKSYMTFKPQNLQLANSSQSVGPDNRVTALRDPWDNPYGYSTAKAADPSGVGYNPTFDLWSTAGNGEPTAWLKNW